MTIKQILAMPIGEKIGGGFPMDIKTFKKKWPMGKNTIQQIIIMDETGEMPIDVNLGPTCTNLRGKIGKEIKIIVAEVQGAEYLGKDRKKLYVDQFSYNVWTGDPGDIYDEERKEWDEHNEKQIRGRVRHGVSCAWISTWPEEFEEPNDTTKQIINAWVEFIMTGE
jgi:hypothetical protein